MAPMGLMQRIFIVWTSFLLGSVHPHAPALEHLPVVAVVRLTLEVALVADVVVRLRPRRAVTVSASQTDDERVMLGFARGRLAALVVGVTVHRRTVTGDKRGEQGTSTEASGE